MPPAANDRFDIGNLMRPATTKRLRRLPLLVRQAVVLVWRAAPRQFAVSAALQVAAGLAVTAQILLGRVLLETLLDEAPLATIVWPLAAFAFATAFVAFANVARLEQQRLLSEMVGRHAEAKVADVATAVDLLAYEQPGFYDRLQRARVNAVLRPVQVAGGVLGLISAGVSVVGVAAALVTLQPWLLPLAVLGYGPAFLAARKASRLLYRFQVEQTQPDRRRHYLFGVMSDRDSAKEVRSFNLGGFLRAQYDDLYDQRIASVRTVVDKRLRLGLAGGVLTAVLAAGTLALLAWLTATGRMDVAAGGAALGAILVLGQRLQVLASSGGSLYESALFLEDFTSFVDTLPRIAAATASDPAPERFSALAVRDVTFTYPTRDAPSLRGVSLDIRAGEVIALVGENGSGKTTLAKVLAGLYGPSAGTVTWDGVDLAAVDPAALREGIAVIFQDFVRYDLTVAENIAVGRYRDGGDRDRILDAARSAGAHQYISALSEAYDTHLGPEYWGGSDLSGGQWQRLALARAFFREASLLILDEPTAALDARGEYELFERVRSLYRGRTVVLISHRFSTVRSADRIYVLHDGQVVEQGSHGELMAQAGRYAELFSLQASAYLEAQR